MYVWLSRSELQAWSKVANGGAFKRKLFLQGKKNYYSPLPMDTGEVTVIQGLPLCGQARTA